VTSARFGPLWLVAGILLAGVSVIGVGQVRLGGFVIIGALLVAALLRLMLPPSRAGGLVVRSRLADVIFLLGMGVALFVIVIALDLQPRA
jgi:Protein of unknown function (DUF3017)